MKIGIQTWGSEGDVRPLIALGAGLRSAGHEVTVAVSNIENRDYSPLGEQFGLTVRSVGRLDPALLMRGGEMALRARSELTQLRAIIHDLYNPLADDMLAAAHDLCRNNDLVIGHFLMHPLGLAAEKSGRPLVTVFLAPLIPSKYIPPPGIPDLGALVNRISWTIGDRILTSFLGPFINDMRACEGLPPVRRIMHNGWPSDFINLVAVSPTLCPPPPDWGSSTFTTGAFLLPEDRDPWQVPEGLERFLKSGPPPVYMTFGSMFAADPDFPATLQLLAESARMAGCRAIIQTNGFAPPSGSPDIYCIARAPHHLLFPACNAIVHHGGSGTTHSASAAGCPSIVVQHATDQAMWGKVLHRAGIAPRALDRRTVTPASLARAIRFVLKSPAMREKARVIGDRMKQKNGVQRAVGHICTRFSLTPDRAKK